MEIEMLGDENVESGVAQRNIFWIRLILREG